jgi:hypothetical protein
MCVFSDTFCNLCCNPCPSFCIFSTQKVGVLCAPCVSPCLMHIFNYSLLVDVHFLNLIVISAMLFYFLVHNKIISKSETWLALSVCGVPTTISMLPQCFDIFWIPSNHWSYLGSICRTPTTAGTLSQYCQVFWIHF